MKIIVLILAVSLLSGCAYKKILTVDTKSKEIRTPYGKVKADIHYKSILCLGALANDCKNFKIN